MFQYIGITSFQFCQDLQALTIRLLLQLYTAGESLLTSTSTKQNTWIPFLSIKKNTGEILQQSSPLYFM